MKLTKVLATSAIRSSGSDTFVATISTPLEDRQGDVIVPTGIDYRDYMAGGGFLLWAHDYSGMPVAKAGRLWADTRGLYGEYRWADHALARQVREAVEALGQMGISIGFIPGQSEVIETGWIYRTCSMLEASLTPVPANPSCMAVLRSKGLLAGGEELVFELVDDEPDDTPIDIDALGQALREFLAEERDMIDVAGCRLPRDEFISMLVDVVEGKIARRFTALTGRLD